MGAVVLLAFTAHRAPLDALRRCLWANFFFDNPKAGCCASPWSLSAENDTCQDLLVAPVSMYGFFFIFLLAILTRRRHSPVTDHLFTQFDARRPILDSFVDSGSGNADHTVLQEAPARKLASSGDTPGSPPIRALALRGINSIRLCRPWAESRARKLTPPQVRDRRQLGDERTPNCASSQSMSLNYSLWANGVYRYRAAAARRRTIAQQIDIEAEGPQRSEHIPQPRRLPRATTGLRPNLAREQEASPASSEVPMSCDDLAPRGVGCSHGAASASLVLVLVRRVQARDEAARVTLCGHGFRTDVDCLLKWLGGWMAYGPAVQTVIWAKTTTSGLRMVLNSSNVVRCGQIDEEPESSAHLKFGDDGSLSIDASTLLNI
ncbi:hypothetical protein DFH06DRAFT_1145728 [Mycena polygramma]|nr:hypothetical protein DFH06DRAFT_1145728 [Mycena polygramma]